MCAQRRGQRGARFLDGKLGLHALILALTLAGCGAPTDQALCAYCENDSQCGGNPCFQDVSGQRFCGRPCDNCPAGFSCQTVQGTGMIAQTCFPDTEACVPEMPPDPNSDAGTGPPPVTDGGRTPGIIVKGPIGPTGGTVDRLLFGITGDTRPAKCGGAYPQAVINAIFTQLGQKQVQFTLDQGDHMFNCTYGDPGIAAAEVYMAHYVQAAALSNATVFMTMGNHECSGSGTSLCNIYQYGGNPNYTAFMDALAPISPLPYYRFDVMTAGGLAAFIVVADDVWDSAEQTWLESQLADADARARFTFVSKHHPDGNTDHPEFQTIYDLVKQHHYTLFLTGHSHLFRRQFDDPRAMILGCGGAPLAGGDFWGYGTVQQDTNDNFTVTIYDQATGNQRVTFSVGP